MNCTKTYGKMFALVVFLWPSVAFSQNVPLLSDYVSIPGDVSADLSKAQRITLDAISNDPAAKNIMIGDASIDQLRTARSLSVQIPTPDEVNTTMDLSFDNIDVDSISNSNFEIFAHDKENQTEISLVIMGRDIFGTIRNLAALYKIHPLGDGLTAVYFYDTNLLRDHPEDFRAEGNEESLRIEREDGAVELDDKRSDISILVLYTGRAGAEAGNVDALISLAIKETNQIYSNSNVQLTVNLAHVSLLEYEESKKMRLDLRRLRKKKDGYLDGIHALRDKHRADLVVMLVSRRDTAGLDI